MLKWILLVLLIPSVVSAATLSGTIYDFSLEPVAGAIVIVNTTPEQTLVATDGTYSLEVPPGSYELHVAQKKAEGFTEEATEQITITDDGNYKLDLILFPEIDDLDFEEPEVVNILEQDAQDASYIIVGINLLVFIALLVILFRLRKTEKKIIEDDTEVELINILKKERRISQRDLRKSFPYSEAKMSLLLADLEERGRIRKIKKGRGNIIIFVK